MGSGGSVRVCFIRATWFEDIGWKLHQCFMHDMVLNVTLAPSLEHQPSASAAWSLALVLAQTGGINSTKPFSTFRALRNPSPSRNVRCTRKRTPPSGRVKNGEMENVTLVPPRLLPQSSPRSPIPPMIVGRTISRAPARPGRGL